MKVKFRTSV